MDEVDVQQQPLVGEHVGGECIGDDTVVFGEDHAPVGQLGQGVQVWPLHR